MEKTQSNKREPLTRQGIVSASFALVEEAGLGGFSTRKLAGRLGCEAMSIYHHFPSKAHLLDAMLDTAIDEMAPPRAGMEPKAALRHWALEFRRMGLRHAGFFPFLSVHRLNTRTGLGWLDIMLGIYRGAGFGEKEAAHFFRVAGFYIVGAVLDETQGYSKGPTAAVEVPSEIVQSDFPNVVAAGQHFAVSQQPAIFELGLDIMLDAIFQPVEAMGGKPPSP